MALVINIVAQPKIKHCRPSRLPAPFSYLPARKNWTKFFFSPNSSHLFPSTPCLSRTTFAWHCHKPMALSCKYVSTLWKIKVAKFFHLFFLFNERLPPLARVRIGRNITLREESGTQCCPEHKVAFFYASCVTQRVVLE